MENNAINTVVRLSDAIDNYATRESAVRLGIDILEQLLELRETEITYKVLTPDDIYVLPTGHFTIANEPENIFEKPHEFVHKSQLYTAPEVYDTESGEAGVIYSVGTIMYMLLNSGLEPFRSAPDFESAVTAYKLRTSGIRLSAPQNADALLSAIIIKACEYSVSRRYNDAEDMLEALKLLCEGTYQRRFKPNVQEEFEETVAVNKIPFVFIGVAAGILILAIIVFVSNLVLNDSYVKADRYLRDGKYDKAHSIYEDMVWYKDSRQMMYKCDCKKSEVLLEEGKTDKAVKVLKELSKKGYEPAYELYNKAILIKAEELTREGKTEEALSLISSVDADDSSETRQHKHSAAMELYETGNYIEAMEVFQSIGDDNMVNECNYCLATDFMIEEDYTEAMIIFAALGDYDDSADRFAECEEALLEKNKEVFASQKDMVGSFEDEEGYFVNYTDEEGKIKSTYNLPFEKADYFRVKDGIHYHSTDEKNWKKQWIYEQKSEEIISVYNYIDGNLYILKRK